MRCKTLLIFAGVASLVFVAGFQAQKGDGFNRERTPQNEAAKNALEGKEPPKLVVTEWKNSSKPLAWNDLKGKVVLVDFWAHW